MPPIVAPGGLRALAATSRLLGARCAASCGTRSLGRDATSNRCISTISTALFPGEATGAACLESPAAARPTITSWITGTLAADASPLARMLYADQKTYLVELLMKQDQMSMAASIESRVPFLDHPLVEFAARVPERLKLRGGTEVHPQEGGRGSAAARASSIAGRWVSRRRCAIGCCDPAPDRSTSAAVAGRFAGGFLDMRAVEGLIERHAGRRRCDRPHLAAASICNCGATCSSPAGGTSGGTAWARAKPLVGAMKILWVKSDFLHPTTKGGQIRTLETLKRVHTRHEIHYVALDHPERAGGVERSLEYCTKAYPIPHRAPPRSLPDSGSRPAPACSRRCRSPSAAIGRMP